MNNILLSVIIPTKNRQYTCIYAIESVLRIDKNDIEIIVQDCSDTNILKDQIIEKFGNDKRIKYEHSTDKPNMTENWNRAYARASGEYQCGIGDDDAVFKHIYDIVLQAKKEGLDIVSHKKDSHYYWSDYSIKSLQNKLVYPNLDTTNSFVQILEKNDLYKSFDNTCKSLYAFRQLPMIYHAIVSKKLIAKIVKVTGKLLDSTSPDVYSGTCIAFFADTWAIYTTPFTLPGACGASNTNRVINNTTDTHYNEFIYLNDIGILPIKNKKLIYTVVEAVTTALKNMNQTEYIKKFDLPSIYSHLLVETISISTIMTILKYSKKNNFNLTDYCRLIVLAIKRLMGHFYHKCKSNIINLIQKTEYGKSYFKKRLSKTTYTFESKNILEALSLIENLK